MPRLRAHILGQLSGDREVADEDNNFSAADLNSLIFHGDCLYSHRKARINYTTYDVRRDRDIIRPADESGKCFVLVACQEEVSATRRNTDLPFWYAQVLGIYHADISILHGTFDVHKHRVEFLHVRWFGSVPGWNSGDKAKRLDQIGFVPHDAVTEPYGFVSLSHIIRACHLIPAFAHGKTSELLPPAAEPGLETLEWRNYYVNKCVVTVSLAN